MRFKLFTIYIFTLIGLISLGLYLAYLQVGFVEEALIFYFTFSSIAIFLLWYWIIELIHRCRNRRYSKQYGI